MYSALFSNMAGKTRLFLDLDLEADKKRRKIGFDILGKMGHVLIAESRATHSLGNWKIVIISR